MPSVASNRNGGTSRNGGSSRHGSPSPSRSGTLQSENGMKSGRQSASEKPERTYPKNKLEYYRKELELLEEESQEREEQIQVPHRKKNKPYVYNSLKPYRDTNALRFAIEQPDNVKHFAVSRNTAGGPCDPWISLDLDTNVFSPRPSIATNRYSRQGSGDKTARSSGTGGRSGKNTSRSTKSSTSGSGKKSSGPKDENNKSSRSEDRKKKSERPEDEDEEGKRTSIYPIVVFYRNDMTGKQLDYSHVPKIRDEVNNTYSMNASKKIDHDYRKTKADFRRRGLDNMDELTPNSRQVLRGAYQAYLQNNPGSTKAVRECVKAEDDKIKQNKQKKLEKLDSDHRSNDGEFIETGSTTSEGSSDNGWHGGEEEYESGVVRGSASLEDGRD